MSGGREPSQIRDRIVGLRRVRADKLLPNPKNWRRHPKAQGEALEGLLAEIGYADALLVRETPDGLMLIDGHLRAETTPKANVPVLVLDVTEEEADKLLLTLDPLAAMAEMDGAATQALLEGVETESEGVRAMLAGLQDEAQRAVGPREGLADADAVPEPPEEPVSKRGDVWACGEHRVMCGDSTSEEDVAQLMAGAEIDLVLTDPPYGINIVRGLSAIGGAKPFGRVRQPGGRPAGVLKGKVGVPGVVKPRLYAPVYGDDMPFDPTFLLRLGNKQVIFGGAYFADKLPSGTSWLCWDKGVAETATFSAFELAWTSLPGRYRMYRHRWSGMVRQGSRAEELVDRVHPTQKPVGLFAEITQDLSDGAILDPFLGSGSTMIAAERLGRRCYGMEIEARYVDVAVRRWEAFTGRKAEILHKTEAVSA